MNDSNLFDRLHPGKVVTAGVIGAGQYATAVVTQSAGVRRLRIPAIADLDAAAARKAFRLAGYPDASIVAAGSREAAQAAIDAGSRVIVEDGTLLAELSLDVIVEATGHPEAGARHALAAIRHGKHVAMVNKEADVTVGPILCRKARQAGVVYTAVDGDQHGLLMGLVSWARELDLEVLCGGKFRNGEIVCDVSSRTVSRGKTTIAATREEAALFEPVAPGRARQFVEGRRKVCGAMADISDSDLGEMTIAANATGLLPDVDTLHGAVLRAAEIPEVLCPVEDGGILSRRGAIEEVICLRHPWEAGLGGGVFIVVACRNAYSLDTLTTKGLIPNQKRTAALIYRPYHLCGVETPMTILEAGLLGVGTGSAEYAPRVDLVALARKGAHPGDLLRGNLTARIRPARPVEGDGPLPFYMAEGSHLTAYVAAMHTVKAASVVAPTESTLWALRAEQDRCFLPST